MIDADATWRELRDGVVAAVVERDFVSVTGPDALTWLQGQLSQDLLGLADGASTDSLLLSPQGKMVALVRVTRVGAEEMLLDADAGAGEAIVERLSCFKLRVKAQVAAQPEWRCVGLRGPRAAEVLAADRSGAELALPWRWPGDEGIDLLGPSVDVPPGVSLGEAGALDAARIAAGVPRTGSEIGERTIPQETGVVGRTVSFDKGCYTGQELVARIDARGSRVPRLLRGVLFEEAAVPGTAGPEPGTELTIDGRQVGSLTSVALSPATGASIALAYVRREVEPPARCSTSFGEARVESLPMAAASPRGSGTAERDGG